MTKSFAIWVTDNDVPKHSGFKLSCNFKIQFFKIWSEKPQNLVY